MYILTPKSAYTYFLPRVYRTQAHYVNAVKIKENFDQHIKDTVFISEEGRRRWLESIAPSQTSQETSADPHRAQAPTP